jgi:hypothetical protein
MQFLQRERVVIVTAQTRLQKLKKKFNTVAQTKFYMKNMGGDFEELEEEDNVMNLSINQAQRRFSISQEKAWQAVGDCRSGCHRPFECCFWKIIWSWSS